MAEVVNKFKNGGVVFQLLKIKSSSSDNVMSSPELTNIFDVDKTDGNNLYLKLSGICESRQRSFKLI